ncbi:MAG: hypothetical protein ACP5PJ_07600 [Acidimicrobiales bacterium]
MNERATAGEEDSLHHSHDCEICAEAAAREDRLMRRIRVLEGERRRLLAQLAARDFERPPHYE